MVGKMIIRFKREFGHQIVKDQNTNNEKFLNIIEIGRKSWYVGLILGNGVGGGDGIQMDLGKDTSEKLNIFMAVFSAMSGKYQ